MPKRKRFLGKLYITTRQTFAKVDFYNIKYGDPITVNKKYRWNIKGVEVKDNEGRLMAIVPKGTVLVYWCEDDSSTGQMDMYLPDLIKRHSLTKYKSIPFITMFDRQLSASLPSDSVKNSMGAVSTFLLRVSDDNLSAMKNIRRVQKFYCLTKKGVKSD